MRALCLLFVLGLCVHRRATVGQIVSSSANLPAVCQDGALDVSGKCVCKPGFAEYQGNCYRVSRSIGTTGHLGCPLGSVERLGFCHFIPVPPMREVIPAQEKVIVVPPWRIELPLPVLPDEDEDEEPIPEDDRDVEEVIAPPVKLTFEKSVNNHNVINNATTVHTSNVNNVFVHMTRKLPSGAIRTVVIRNNETTVYDEDEYNGKASTTAPGPATTAPHTTTKQPPCCKIVGPRVCRKQADEWVCFHRKHYVCNEVCTADEMYLRPRPRQRCPPGRCSISDCSECLRSNRRCHPMCYPYDCGGSSCHFVDADSLCRDSLQYVCVLLEEKIIEPSGN
ncbi:uncharacterized protein LOC126572325 [Anopheles aquasalis]|uniref:uncharacterized protein LOC126572325 n=1 Tax=Anopheles aquasalis TaxID=42839 RepID=UPI00215B3413|nr:uncharacterized protein LOC126572325 [Anopheles aquasalis]